jgi:hypothetical protein
LLLAEFDPPGGLNDLDATGLGTWNTFLSGVVDNAIAGAPNHTNDSPRAQFYNLTKTETDADEKNQDVTWIAFPRQVAIRAGSDAQRWTRADASRDLQDEYCEWCVTRRSTDNKITRVTFTCEGPEYWEILAAASPQTALSIYQQHVSPDVQEGDLFDSGGKYIERNRWNTDTTEGAMHLVQENNTLGAEIELAAAATIVRVINGRTLTGQQELINCSQYGASERNSDPLIGGVVNGVAQLKADIALANPVGLYFDDLSTAGWAAPDDSDPKTFWSLTRGTIGHFVRAVYEVPSDKPFVVGDITINGTPIRFGGQIADFISMKLTAVACRFGKSTVAPMTACVGVAPKSAGIKRLVAGTKTLNASRYA